MRTKNIIAVVLSLVLLMGVVTYAMGTSDDRGMLVSTLEIDTPVVPVPFAVDSSLPQKAIGRAEFLILQAQSSISAKEEAVQKILNSAIENVRNSKSEENSWEALASARLASVDAMIAVAYGQAKEGKLNEKDVLDQVPGWAGKIQHLETRLTYKGMSFQDALISRAEVERSLSSADSWLEQVPGILNLDKVPREMRLAQAMGSFEAVRGNLEDAEFLLSSVQNKGTNQEEVITDAYERFHGKATLGIDSTVTRGSFAELTFNEAKGFIERAELRFNSGYKASATTDIMCAFITLQILDVLSEVPDPWFGEAVITVEDIYRDKEQAVRALNEAIESAGGDGIELYLLQSVRSDIETADYLIEMNMSTITYGDTEGLAFAHAFYVRALSYAGSVHKVTELLEG